MQPARRVSRLEPLEQDEPVAEIAVAHHRAGQVVAGLERHVRLAGLLECGDRLPEERTRAAGVPRVHVRHAGVRRRDRRGVRVARTGRHARRAEVGPDGGRQVAGEPEGVRPVHGERRPPEVGPRPADPPFRQVGEAQGVVHPPRDGEGVDAQHVRLRRPFGIAALQQGLGRATKPLRGRARRSRALQRPPFENAEAPGERRHATAPGGRRQGRGRDGLALRRAYVDRVERLHPEGPLDVPVEQGGRDRRDRLRARPAGVFGRWFRTTRSLVTPGGLPRPA